MPQPHSLASIAGWRTTTLFTRTPGWAIAHRENTSMLNPNPPRVRSDRVNSNHRHDKVQVFEVEVSDAPKIRIDNREIVEARFFTLAEAQSLKLPKPLYDYLSARAAGIGPR